MIIHPLIIFITVLIYHKYAPLKKLTKKQIKTMSKPWISQGILTSIKKRDQLFKLFIKSKNPIEKSTIEKQYKQYRNLIVCLCRRSKKNYFSHYFKEHSKNIQKIWQGVINQLFLHNLPKVVHHPLSISIKLFHLILL